MRKRRSSRDTTGINDKVQIYRDVKKEWRWRRLAPNGKVVGASSESFKKLADCRANLSRVMAWYESDLDEIMLDGKIL